LTFPRRLEMLVAKATVLTAVVVVAGTVSVLGSLLAGQRAAAGNGFTAKHGFLPTTLAHGPMGDALQGAVDLGDT
jgi:ABC-2 type transport system permease protein